MVKVSWAAGLQDLKPEIESAWWERELHAGKGCQSWSEHL